MSWRAMHEETSNTRLLGPKSPAGAVHESLPPLLPDERDVVRLEQPSAMPVDLRELIGRRRSRRRFQGGLSLAELGGLCWAAAGRTESGRHTHPSAGALPGTALWVAVFDADGLDDGVYRYVPESHALERRPWGAPGRIWPALFVDAGMALRCSCAFVFTIRPAETTAKYQGRGYRFLLLEVGHMAQNLLLAATAYELAACPVGGFYDADLDAALGCLPGQEAAVYAVLAGAREEVSPPCA
ncbi:SagB-type dehydrogenase domain-containing protein [Nonomuraea solani]|uniref:SagB-type dehydrogenase domain-containing protein n=1 Tax=Nonomuraea solani TaxID=1144553 RepID=A0A1H6ES30_9ACTN|nr:SagB/ThcOx family dehydrogenase [Nonomuraea solani]SEH00213.1 SagB-type dehydrogenase domain-containing protein [Nonomuraea solani]